MEFKFIVDANVGKLAKWLRIAGFDTVFINGITDDDLVRIGLSEGRILLTKDTQILHRRVVTSGELKVILIRDDDVKGQLGQVLSTLGLVGEVRPFSRCLECNQPLLPRSKDDVQGLVPPYVFMTQSQYVQCPSCHRIYWRGTHWQRMSREISELVEG